MSLDIVLYKMIKSHWLVPRLCAARVGSLVSVLIESNNGTGNLVAMRSSSPTASETFEF